MNRSRTTVRWQILIGATVFCLVGSSDALAQRKHADLMMEAESMAVEYRAASEESGRKDEVKAKVTALVTKSFDSRQNEQRQQIDEMKEKLRMAEQTLVDRDKIRDRIIARKVEDLVSGQSADWKDAVAVEKQQFDMIGIGDTVTIHLEGVLPFNPPKQPPSPPQVNILKSGRIVTGFPFVVGSDGAITLPLLGTLEIAGLSVRAAEKKIGKAYVDRDILRPDRATPTVTLVPRQEARFNVIDAAGKPSVPEPAVTVSSGRVASFADTYGRLSLARDLVAEIESGQQGIAILQRRYADRPKTEQVEAQFASAREQISAAKFKLGLEKDYIADTLEFLKSDLDAAKTLAQESQANYARSERLFQAGTLSASEHGSARASQAQKESDLRKAEKKLSQYQKIQKRWNELVGEALNVSQDSEKSVDKGTRR